MAAPTTENSVNGNYASHPNYQSAESYQPAQSTNAQAPSQSTEPESATPAQSPSSAEIGWYFVEQYYTTMSKEPGKLFLFYTKKSQFVAGNEAEQVSVAVGPKKISEMISKLDIQDCKVRVSNVDTQQSGKNILVQVIGEISNRATPLRKFVQTFVLAEQPTGYYVLNDIFRYIADDEEEEDEPSAERVAVPAETAESKTEHKTLASSQDPAEKQRDVELVDQKLQKTVSDESAQVPTVVKSSPEKQASAETANQENSAVAQETSETVENSAIEDATKQVAQEEVTQTEKPRDPEPTPSASPPKPAKAVPAEVPSGPPKPSVPKTWANLVASKGTSGPAATAPQKSTTAAAPASSAPKAVNTAVKENSSPSAPVNEDSTARPQSNGGAAWQNVGSDKQRQNRQQSVSNASENVLAYVKNVTEKVDPNALRTALANFGKIVYFDVSRPKNCAFVEFADSAGYNACVSANPHTVSGEQVFVEERRPRNAGYGGNFGPRGGMRGGRGGLNDRPGNQGRGGFNKDGGRGGFAPRGRGGALTPRGRGQPQPA